MLCVNSIGASLPRVTRGLALAAFFSSASFAGLITTTYSPSELTRIEITGTPSVIWTATFDFVSNLLPDFTSSPLLSQEFAATVWQKGLPFMAEAKSELVINILASGISN